MNEDNATQLSRRKSTPEGTWQKSLLRLMTLLGSAAMLASAFLLPLVNLKSYRFTIDVLPHKIERLVRDANNQIVGYVLLALLVLTPLIVFLCALWRGRAPKAVAILPVLVSLALVVLLLLANKPNPGLGLWVYLGVAMLTMGLSFWRIK